MASRVFIAIVYAIVSTIVGTLVAARVAEDAWPAPAWFLTFSALTIVALDFLLRLEVHIFVQSTLLARTQNFDHRPLSDVQKIAL